MVVCTMLDVLLRTVFGRRFGRVCNTGRLGLERFPEVLVNGTSY